MPDITMCKGDGCPLKLDCYRFRATPSQYRQSYFVTPPIKEDGTCSHQMPMSKFREEWADE